jgi:hypothetical protein
MNHHSRRVDDSTQSGFYLKPDFLLEERIEGLERESRISWLGKLLLMEDFFSHPPQCFPDRFDHHISRIDL